MPTEREGIVKTIKPDWQDSDIENFAGGLNSSKSIDSIKNNQLTLATNVRVDRDILVGDLGYYPYKTVSTTLSASYIAGDTALTVSPAGNKDAKIGGKIYVNLDNGSVFITTIAAITPTTYTLSEGLPSAATSGNRVEAERYLIGSPLKFHKLELTNGSTLYFMLTTKTLYKDSSLGYWEPVGRSTINTTVSGILTDTTEISVTDTTGFAVGDVIRVARTNSKYYVGIITSITPGTPGVLSCANETITGTATGQAVRKCITLTGTVSDKISAVSIPWADQMVFTNGLDAIQVYDDTTGFVSDLTGLPSGGNTKAKSLAVYDSSLFLISTIEGGVNYRQRIRYCDNADIIEWVAGNAGSVDLLDTTKECYAGKILGPYMYIYRSKGIFRVSRSQREDRRFDFDEMITNHGILSSDCLQEIAENQHAIFDDENIFLYDGGFSVDPIGTPIKRDIFGLTGIMDITAKRKNSLLYVPELRALYAVFQAAGTSSPLLSYRYSIDEKAWTTRVFPAPAYSMGYGNQASAVTWQTVQGIWSSANYAWNAAITAALADTILLGIGDHPAGGSYVYQQSSETDANSDISYTVQTKNFIENYKLRFDWIDVWCSGGTIVVEYSINRGQSWANYGTITASVDIARHRVSRQFISEQYMFRFRSTDPNFSILKLRMRLAPETEQ